MKDMQESMMSMHNAFQESNQEFMQNVMQMQMQMQLMPQQQDSGYNYGRSDYDHGNSGDVYGNEEMQMQMFNAMQEPEFWQDLNIEPGYAIEIKAKNGNSLTIRNEKGPCRVGKHKFVRDEYGMFCEHCGWDQKQVAEQLYNMD
eukprot:CAMPEP_0201571310 /NCGR_PEP_ID=MMETSP0190_2-20130828/14015_1 /ASSEMBLY_ACC=CAM_ASM_000263 /TAXON_ID=37353 /ORGANISM="Rosalina sp." /LENGTH=143 /DNA_ID=CAMNT_0047995803 /DNA_START=217 /DNA_END=648 /DNA_ORIENTATION=-